MLNLKFLSRGRKCVDHDVAIDTDVNITFGVAGVIKLGFIQNHFIRDVIRKFSSRNEDQLQVRSCYRKGSLDLIELLMSTEPLKYFHPGAPHH